MDGEHIDRKRHVLSPPPPFVKMLLVSAVQAYSEPETYAILGPSHMTSVAKTFTGVENVLDITPDMGLNVIRWAG